MIFQIIYISVLLYCCLGYYSCEAFTVVGVTDANAAIRLRSTSSTTTPTTSRTTSTTTTTANRISSSDSTSSSSSSSALFSSTSTSNTHSAYDDWRSNAYIGSNTLHLDEDNVINCLDEFINSDFGTKMFGCHDRASSVGITGGIQFSGLCGPEVTLELEGQFWHSRGYVLGSAATWLNARIPEISEVVVDNKEELQDYEEITSKTSGDVLFRIDKRSADYDGDRGSMEHHGVDPDMKGPTIPIQSIEVVWF